MDSNEFRIFKQQHKIIPIKEQNENLEKFSEISELKSEIDEWAALNKFAVYQAYKEQQERKEKKLFTAQKMKEELDKQA